MRMVSVSMRGVMAAMLATGAMLASGPAEAQRDPAAMLVDADRDGDGVVTRAEFLAARAARFDKLDRNHDGVISRDDFGRLARFRPQAGERIDSFITELDTNHDGKVERSELANARTPVFDMADTNHDGRVDKAELAAFRTRAEQMRQQRQQRSGR